MSDPISDFGFSVVHAPEDGSPILDIVIVHGLQGHPFKTWACTKTPRADPSRHKSSSEIPQDAKKRHNNILRRILSKISARSSQKVSATKPSDVAPSAGDASNNSAVVFWPRDLAPKDCPRSRILVYGYDTKVSGYMVTPPNRNHVLSHGKDLLYALCRERTHNRPLVFLAHSLGGIVVKEALAASSASADADLKNVVDSTAAVIFMGTPHRGSPDLSALGEWARSVLSIFRMETSSAVLDTLGLKTSDLERAQESFSGLWSKYDFRVKTFQESLGLTGIHLGVLGNKVVPDYSSLLGDQRERAESITANHMDMCRFTGADDPNYRRVVGELSLIYRSIKSVNEYNTHQNDLTQRRLLDSQLQSSARDCNQGCDDKFRDAVKSFHQNLEFPTMKYRYRSIPRPAAETCSWLFDHETYHDWLNGENPASHEGLLLLVGKPGAGKSVVMKEAHRRISSGKANSADIIATCFFHAQGQRLDRSYDGMFRSLLYQLLPLYEEDADLIESLRDSEDAQSLQNLKEFFELLFSRSQKRKTYIFIDALDECELDGRQVALFWRQITRKAYTSGAQLNVIMSIRHFPHMSLSNCPLIRVDHCNQHDIALYVEQRINLAALPEQTLVSLKSMLIEKSQGVFLWAMLMVERMIEKWHDGEGLSTLLADNAPLPTELDTLFTEILAPVNAELKQVTVRLFQWASLSVVPLRLYEWHHIMAFVRRPEIRSLRAWRMSDQFTESDDQLERLIVSMSRGLLEVRTMSTVLDNGQESMSTRAGAGSLDNSYGETRVVEFIHQSVRDFFLQGRGFSSLDPSLEGKGQAAGHLQIMSTCLDYLDIAELDALVDARHHYPRYGTSKKYEPTEPSTSRDIPCEIQIKERDRESEEVHLHSPKAKSPKGYALLESLKPLSMNTCGIDIDQWMATNQFVMRQGSSGESFCGSEIRLSIDAPTQVLQDHPALLSYSTWALFSHARRAQCAHANPETVVRRLQQGSWKRWLLLSESSSQFLLLHDFARSYSLESWYPYMAQNTEDSNTEDDEFFTRKFREKWPRYASSVASFASAGSHDSCRGSESSRTRREWDAIKAKLNIPQTDIKTIFRLLKTYTVGDEYSSPSDPSEFHTEDPSDFFETS